MGILKYFTKQVYGNTLMYPANQTALIFANLTKQKTISPEAITAAKQLGFTVERVFEDESEIK